MEAIETFENMLNFLNKIENKEKTLDEFLNSIFNEKIIKAQILTEKLIQQEIKQNKSLLLFLKNKFDKMKIQMV